MPDTPLDWTGTPAERWQLRGRIGQGAQGEVHLAHDVVLDRQVAVKLFRSPSMAGWARRESTALLALDLPCVVALLDLGTTPGGRPFLVLEHVAGETFPGVGRRGWTQVLGPLVGLLSALRLVHAAGVVHRDLRAEHVRIQGRRIVLLDFGVGAGEGAGAARAADDPGGVGHPRYMAPEQVEGAGVDGRADLYTVGALVYEALSGRAWPGVASVLRGEAPALDDLPHEARALLPRLLAVDPADRPASAAEVLALLGRDEAKDVIRAYAHWSALPVDAPLATAFAGPDRLCAWPRRLEALLRRRAGPWPSAWAPELSAWVHAGRARVEGDVHVTAADAAWLDDGPDLRPPPPGPGGPLHAFVHLGWPCAEDEHVHARFGAVTDPSLRRVPGGWRVTFAPPPDLYPEAHRQWVALLPPGEPRRLRHLLALGQAAEVVEEARAAAERCLAEGDAHGALQRAQVGLQVARAHGLAEGPLLVEAACAGLSASDAASLRRARHEASRSRAPGAVGTLLDAAGPARARRVEEALPSLRALPQFDDERLDRWRFGLAVEATQARAGPEVEAVLAEAEAWARTRGTPTASADVQGWRGSRRLSSGAFAEALRDLEAAWPDKGTASARVSTRANAAVARMELGRFGDAESEARAVLAEAEGRFPGHAATAEWVLRSVAWRRGERRSPDLALVEATEALGLQALRAQIALTEAAFAWRRRDAPECARLARKALEVWRPEGGAVWLLAEALRWVGEGGDVGPLEARIAVELHRAVPGLALQALAVARTVAPELGKDLDAAGAWRRLDPALAWGIRELVDLSVAFGSQTLSPHT